MSVPLIICEIGSNWQTLDDCLMSIRAAKNCGADAVKFQLFDWFGLYGVDARVFHDGRFSHRIDTATNKCWRVLPGAIEKEWLTRLKSESERVGIEFMCSAFSPELINAVDPFVKRHKVASAELTHVRMLERLREIGKPMILSTGASGIQDIREALRILENTAVTLLYCVAAYPARVINLDLIPVMRAQFGVDVGYSDHSTDALNLPYLAAQMGATVIEKHVTFIDAETPDSPHSLNEREFKMMVSRLRGNPVSGLGATHEETEMVTRHNRRLIATKDINLGETFQENVNFGIYRSLRDDSKALSPFLVGQVNGRTAKNKISAGDGIGPQDI